MLNFSLKIPAELQEKQEELIKKYCENAESRINKEDTIIETADSRRTRILQYSHTIVIKSQDYAKLASKGKLFELVHPESIDLVLDGKKVTQSTNSEDFRYNMNRAYDSNFGKRESIRRKELLRSSSYSHHSHCPYCGSLIKVDEEELDHFLPKQMYPLFASTPINLVPCCRNCNGKKSSRLPYELIPDKTGVLNYRQIFHPYFDHYNFDLTSSLTYERNTTIDGLCLPTFGIKFQFIFENKEMQKRGDYHVEFFQLKKRFLGLFTHLNTELMDKACHLAANCKNGQDLKEKIKKVYTPNNTGDDINRYKIDYYGRNIWERLFNTEDENSAYYWNALWAYYKRQSPFFVDQ